LANKPSCITSALRRVTLAGVQRPVLLWDDHNIAHIARHSVTVSEVEQVLSGDETIAVRNDTHRVGRIELWGITLDGRWLLVVLDPPGPRNTAYVVTARPMTTRESRQFKEAPSD
jgi:uncharacterized DUF497 family protein